MLSRVKLFPKCLPAKEDLQAAYLGKVTPSSAGVVVDESENSNDAQLINSNCATFDGTAKLLIAGLNGTETISNEGTAVGTVGAGEITFTSGTCWNIELSNGSKYACAEGGLSDTLHDIVNGINATITGATLSAFWGSTQDIYHYNFLNGFDLYENGTAGQEIRIPIGATIATAGYTYTATYQAGKWHNNAETQIQLPASLSSIQDSTPVSSLTDNKFLKWVEGGTSPKNFITNIGTVTEEANGTRFVAGAGGNVYITSLNVAVGVVGKTYNYYVEVTEQLAGNMYIAFAGINTIINGVGVHTGSFVATGTNALRINRNASPTDVTISKFYIWEDGTVPLLSYSEMETNFNDANRAFSSMIEGKHSKLVFYDRVLTTEEMLKLQKCLDVKSSEYVLTGGNGVILTDENGLILVAE